MSLPVYVALHLSYLLCGCRASWTEHKPKVLLTQLSPSICKLSPVCLSAVRLPSVPIATTPLGADLAIRFPLFLMGRIPFPLRWMLAVLQTDPLSKLGVK